MFAKHVEASDDSVEVLSFIKIWTYNESTYRARNDMEVSLE